MQCHEVPVKRPEENDYICQKLSDL